MKLIAVFVVKCFVGSGEVEFLCSASDLSGYSFYQRSAAREGLKFLVRTATPRLPVGVAHEVDFEGSLAFALRFSDGLATLAVGDRDYPSRLAFRCLRQAHDEFVVAVPSEKWRNLKKSNSTSSNHPEIHFQDSLARLLKEFANPRNSDEIVQALEKAERAQAVVRKTVSEVLRHGESLNELIIKSEDLSATSKQLFKSSAKVKQSFNCCKVQ